MVTGVEARMDLKNQIWAVIGWWSMQTFSKCYLILLRTICCHSYTLYMRKLRHKDARKLGGAKQCMEELNSLPGSLAWVQALNFCFPLDMQEKAILKSWHFSLLAVASIKRRNMSFVGAYAGSVLGSTLMSFFMLFHNLSHSRELSYHLITGDFTFFSV